MPQQATAEQKYKRGNESFPILYEDRCVRVYKNPSGEIFVENVRDETATLRITPDYEGFLITAHDGTLEPWAVRGLPAFRVRGRS